MRLERMRGAMQQGGSRASSCRTLVRVQARQRERYGDLSRDLGRALLGLPIDAGAAPSMGTILNTTSSPAPVTRDRTSHGVRVPRWS